MIPAPSSEEGSRMGRPLLIRECPCLTVRRLLLTSERVKRQAGDAGDSREILVERKNACVMFNCNGGNQGIDRGEQMPFARAPR